MNKENFPEWRQKLKSSQQKEGKSSSSRWIQLSTINADNEPSIRTVVFRGWLDSTSMLIFTDSRSQKIKDLNGNSNVEILWLFVKSKSQFRFKGKTFLIDDDSVYWSNLSNKSKSTWFWPNPGTKLIEDIVPTQNNEYQNKPNNFKVIKVQIEYVDLLKLEQPVHKRFCWSKSSNWKCVKLNP